MFGVITKMVLIRILLTGNQEHEIYRLKCREISVIIYTAACRMLNKRKTTSRYVWRSEASIPHSNETGRWKSSSLVVRLAVLLMGVDILLGQ